MRHLANTSHLSKEAYLRKTPKNGKSRDKLVIPGPKKLSIFKGAGSMSAHPITKDEIEAISGPYLDLARSWIPESVETSEAEPR